MNQIDSVSVEAPARLHMGFLDPSASLNRKFGGVGIALAEISTRVTVRRFAHLEVQGSQTERASSVARKFLEDLNLDGGVQIEIHEAIPEHVGLGSGTQLALAVGYALSQLFGLGLGVRDVARLAGRGARSGIGIGTFEFGGLIVDGGRGEHSETPPILCRLPVPESWRFILVFDQRGQGLTGAHELEAFQRLESFPKESAAHICHLLLMQGLPALAERNIAGFGRVITEIQRLVGDYFALAQGGPFMSRDVEGAIHWFGAQGAVALGQTSWGPTGFCAVENSNRAHDLVHRIQCLSRSSAQLDFHIVSPRNSGAESVVATLRQGLSERASLARDSTCS